jgi:hypothetical protein
MDSLDGQLADAEARWAGETTKGLTTGRSPIYLTGWAVVKEFTLSGFLKAASNRCSAS